MSLKRRNLSALVFLINLITKVNLNCISGFYNHTVSDLGNHLKSAGLKNLSKPNKN